MKVHFIAIGGSVMHNLAIALKNQGIEVTGSDDEIFEPSRSRLASHGLLPADEGWHPARVNKTIDAVILGMHAHLDNPELIKAINLGLKVYSYPEYVHMCCQNSTRIVIAGSHGKTTVTAMIMHALKVAGINFDYMIGAPAEGFEGTVKLSGDAGIAVIEGDEYLSSPLDPTPKFLWYKPHLAVITGVSWDHVNVFPDEGQYVNQFHLFANSIGQDGFITWYENDPALARIISNLNSGATTKSYTTLENKVVDNVSTVLHGGKEFPVAVFGSHNFQNMAAAMNICGELGITPSNFLVAMKTFIGAARRLQLIGEGDRTAVFHDFAHAPSKLRATINAVKERYPDRHLTAIFELHTFSSLNTNFLPRYAGTMEMADLPVVYFNPEVIERKKMPPLSPGQVAGAFNIPLTSVVTDKRGIETILNQSKPPKKNLLIMSSGNFGGISTSWFVENWFS